ncbi:MAG: 23S rRNA (uracil(1939)-C(5))-methyltransferase RlmD [Gammaproteobacteria bacterium]|nr:23S rRNA (uracil(1939)-C(5))-methyltransferase RlmD [Gammaproteobacteria bacterium]
MKRLSVAPEEADIVDLSHEGHGVARLDGKAVFVADALPGERVVLRRVKRHRNFDEAVLEQVLVPSPDRVPAECPHFGVCGGCALQHLAPASQLAFKQSQLLENLARLGGVEPATVLPPLLGPVWGYRRRARLGIKLVPRKGRVLVGFRERSAPYIADLHECRVLAAPAGTLLDALSALVASLSIAARVPQAEIAVVGGSCAIVLRVLDPPTETDLARLREFQSQQPVRIYLQPGGVETVRSLDAGAPPLAYELPAFGVRLEFEPTDFIQVNGVLNEAMVSRAVELLELEGNHAVLDLFCGLGNFSLPLATRAEQVVGIEGETGLVARARQNAERNGLTNTQFHAANLAEDSTEAPWAARAYDRVLLDPPRAGAREVLPVVGRCGAGRVVYISCHPGSLARDAGILVREHGFRLAAAGVMDMFPHTTHVEAVAVFER